MDEKIINTACSKKDEELLQRFVLFLSVGRSSSVRSGAKQLTQGFPFGEAVTTQGVTDEEKAGVRYGYLIS